MTTKKDSDNIFELFGFDADKAADLELRSKLLIEITQRVTPLGLTQKKGAELLDINQPRFNDLVSHKINKFSVDALVKMLGKLGQTIAVVPMVSPRPSWPERGYYREVVASQGKGPRKFSWRPATANGGTTFLLNQDSTAYPYAANAAFAALPEQPLTSHLIRPYLGGLNA